MNSRLGQRDVGLRRRVCAERHSVALLLKPRAVCGAFRSPSGGFSRSREAGRSGAEDHLRSRRAPPAPAPPQANEFAAGTTRCRPSPTGLRRTATAVLLLKPRAVCGAFRCRCGEFTRSREAGRSGAEDHLRSRRAPPAPAPPQANEFAAGTTRCRPSPTGVHRTECHGASVKPRAVCGAFRCRCGEFTRSREAGRSAPGEHLPRPPRPGE
jgi:hypothetical protein